MARSAGNVGHPEYTTKALRHFAASLWVKAGADRFHVMKAGGWSSLDMVSQVYAHLFPSDASDLAHRISGLDWDALD